MSTPPTTGPYDTEHRKSLGKYVKRMSSVFKRDKSSKSAPHSSGAAAGPVVPVVPEAEPQQSQVEAPKEGVAKEEVATPEVEQELTKVQSVRQEQSTENLVSAPAATATTTATSTEDLTPTATAQPPASTISSPVLDRNAMQQERARALFAKYGLTLESHEWIASPAPASVVPRVEKAIRMRVHRSCHRCGTLYGHDKVCLQCEHKRCKKCPRYPKKKTPGEKNKEKEVAEQPKKKKVLTVTTRSGNELAYQPATQRVRRSCHKCESLFVPPTATTCESCKHIRCTKCPREPAKRSKWPIGYPGDVEAESDEEMTKQLEQFRRIWRKPRRIVRWECEQCHSLFRQGSPQCPGCGHERCDQCTRSPVKKPVKEESFDPAVVAAVEAKLRALGVDDDSPISGPEHA